MHRRQKRLTSQSNYDCALRTHEILTSGMYSSREQLIARKWFIEGKNAYAIANEKVVEGKRGYLSEDMIRNIINSLYKNLIVYDERPTKSKRTRDTEHMRRMWKLKKELITEDSECCVCGSRSDLELDHIITYAIGGTDDPSNLQILCHKCHMKKTNQEAKELNWRINPWRKE